MTERPRYSVELTTAAAKSLRKLPKDILTRVSRIIDDLAYEPHPSGCKKLTDTDNLYRLRVGDWRIVYEIEDSRLIVWVLNVGHRRDIYRKR